MLFQADLLLEGRGILLGDRLDVLLGVRGLLATLTYDKVETGLGHIEGLLVACGIAEGAKGAAGDLLGLFGVVDVLLALKHLGFAHDVSPIESTSPDIAARLYQRAQCDVTFSISPIQVWKQSCSICSLFAWIAAIHLLIICIRIVSFPFTCALCADVFAGKGLNLMACTRPTGKKPFTGKIRPPTRAVRRNAEIHHRYSFFRTGYIPMGQTDNPRGRKNGGIT